MLAQVQNILPVMQGLSSAFPSSTSAFNPLNYPNWNDPQAVKDWITPDFSNFANQLGSLAATRANDPSNTPAADAANSDENQDYMSGLATSLGEQQLQQMIYNEYRDNKLMGWYENMSNTAYQRAMKDMKDAGLNPILAYAQGGAQTPSVNMSNYSLGGGDTLTDFVNMITGGTADLLKAVASFIPSVGKAADIVASGKRYTAGFAIPS